MPKNVFDQQMKAIVESVGPSFSNVFAGLFIASAFLFVLIAVCFS